MKITIDVNVKYLAALSIALAEFKGDDVTDEEVAAFISMDLNARYESIQEHIGFGEELELMKDELEELFV